MLLQEVRHCFEVNVFGTIFVTQAVLPIMKAQKKGFIMNMSALGGVSGPCSSVMTTWADWCLARFVVGTISYSEIWWWWEWWVPSMFSLSCHPYSYVYGQSAWIRERSLVVFSTPCAATGGLILMHRYYHTLLLGFGGGVLADRWNRDGSSIDQY